MMGIIFQNQEFTKSGAFDQSDKFETVDRTDEFEKFERIEEFSISNLNDCTPYCQVLMALSDIDQSHTLLTLASLNQVI